MVRTKSPQELFWAGEFGNEYTERNQVEPQDREPFFASILQKTLGVVSICELGTNRGHNLQAIRNLSPNYDLTGVELNPQAFEKLQQRQGITAHHSSILDFEPGRTFDFTFTCGVLIHINPDDLSTVYDKLFNLSRRYIMVQEYFNPTPTEINYRGHEERLYKRDFAGELMDRYPGQLRLVDYGFIWKRACDTGDNSTWFLLEKI